MGAYTANHVEEVRAMAPVNETSASGVSWAAVLAGAFVSAALWLILLALGSGLGLASISPWANEGASATAISAAGIVWVILTQIIAAALGGYLAGRLRTKWATIHTDEVYFRDTAHGLLVWAVSLVVTAAFLTTASVFMAGQTASAADSRPAATAVRSADPNAYFVDEMFRSERPAAEASDTVVKAEAGRIVANGLREKQIPIADNAYLAQLVSARTGLSQAEAARRVGEVFTMAQAAADEARRATSHLLMWTFLALLIGAFVGSFSATIGGRQRDHVRTV